MPVDPDVIFVDWEIAKEELPEEHPPVAMRVTGVTTDHVSGASGRRVLELQLDGRVGSGFFDIGMPGGEVTVEIGVGLAEEFSPVIKSPAVSMPLWVSPEEYGTLETPTESGRPVGY